MTWTTPNTSRVAAGDVLLAANFNNLEGNFAHLVDSNYQIDSPGSNLTLTTSYQDLPTCSITLAKSGVYAIRANVGFIGDGAGGDANQELLVQLVVNSVAQTGEIITESGTVTTPQHNASREWIYTAASAGLVAKLQGKKAGGTGGSVVRFDNTQLIADWKSP